MGSSEGRSCLHSFNICCKDTSVMSSQFWLPWRSSSHHVVLPLKPRWSMAGDMVHGVPSAWLKCLRFLCHNNLFISAVS